jgi:hypothetical protein
VCGKAHLVAESGRKKQNLYQHNAANGLLYRTAKKPSRQLGDFLTLFALGIRRQKQATEQE